MIIERDFLDHWKTQLLITRMGASAPFGLIRLWAHCEARRNDLFTLTSDMLAAITRIPGDPAAVEAALLECRWIEREGPLILVRGWREKNSGWLGRVQGGKNRHANGHDAASGKLTSPHRPNSSDDPASYLPATSDDHAATHAASSASRGGVEWSGVEKRGAPPPPLAVRACEAVLTQTFETLLQILGKKRRAPSCEAMNALSEQAEFLPLAPERWAILRRWMALPADDTDPLIRSRPTDANRFAIRLFSELERAEAFAEKISGGKKSPSASSPPEPPGWREKFAEKYPRAKVPATWADVDSRQQEELR